MAVVGGIAGGVSASLRSGSGESENIPKKVNNFICQILPKLHKNSIEKRELKLCEAYCLLWHHRGNGTVNGRRTSDKLISCAYAAVILDLWTSGKIDIEVRGKLADECVEAVIKVMIAYCHNDNIQCLVHWYSVLVYSSSLSLICYLIR